MRTNIAIDDSLMEQAMQISGLKTKTEVVAAAIYEFVERRTRKDLQALHGRIQFADGYDHKALRAGGQYDPS